MVCFRVTKYDPRNRSENGIYSRHEWTSVSDIGELGPHGILTLDQYMEVESAYVDSVKVFLDLCKIESMIISDLEVREPPTHPDELSDSSRIWLSDVSVDSKVAGFSLEKVVRLALREACWCKLSAENNSYIHFGYDFYMYLGSDKLDQKIFESRLPGLIFAEPMDSPYFETDE